MKSFSFEFKAYMLNHEKKNHKISIQESYFFQIVLTFSKTSSRYHKQQQKPGVSVNLMPNNRQIDRQIYRQIDRQIEVDRGRQMEGC